MASRKQSRGQCLFCNREMSKGGLSRHVKSCSERQAAIAAADEKKSGAAIPIYHLQVGDAYSPDFWLHLEVNGNATLKDLDRYLRGIWLECCGHLSLFSDDWWQGQEFPMNRKVRTVLNQVRELHHIYDFGTSSMTVLKQVDMREGKPLSRHSVFLMARNEQPAEACVDCGESAGWYCVECLIEEGEWVTLCDEHASAHPHRDYGEPMPLVNSPRMGMCGYDGDAEPPY